MNICGLECIDATDTTLDEWEKKWGLETYTGKCGGCENDMKVYIPFYTKGGRGLRAEPCQCGANSLIFSLNAIDPSHPLYMPCLPYRPPRPRRPKLKVIKGGKKN